LEAGSHHVAREQNLEDLLTPFQLPSEVLGKLSQNCRTKSYFERYFLTDSKYALFDVEFEHLSERRVIGSEFEFSLDFPSVFYGHVCFKLVGHENVPDGEFLKFTNEPVVDKKAFGPIPSPARCS
jgi:hypothetical protein